MRVDLCGIMLSRELPTSAAAGAAAEDAHRGGQTCAARTCRSEAAGAKL